MLRVAFRIALAERLVACPCHDGAHGHPECPNRAVLADRAAVYDGLYDGRAAPIGASMNLVRVRILNPDYADEDATGRRFAQLEID